MKRLLVFLVSSIVALVTPVCAQHIDDSLRYAESIWSMQKKAMILEEMDLTEAEKSSFWPVYESYSSAIQYLDLEYIRLANLAEQHQSEKKSAALTENMLINELMLAKARKYYFRKFRKALSASQASRFMQIDSDFRTMIRLQMQKNPPPIVTSLNRIYLPN